MEKKFKIEKILPIIILIDFLSSPVYKSLKIEQ